MRTSTSNKLSAIVLSLFIFLPGVLFYTWPASAQSSDKEKNKPLHIISDKMIAKKDQSMVEFTGNVKVTQTDTILLADSVKIFFNPEDNGKQTDAAGNVNKIISTGNVNYTQGDRKGFADKAVYTSADETLILTGSAPRLVTGSSFVTGKKITLFRNQEKVLVESDGTQRVEALFNPEDNPQTNQND